MTDQAAIEADVDRYVAAYLDVAAAADREGYVAVGDAAALPSTARAQSATWCRQLLSASADPHRAPASHAFHRASGPTYDLLRHEVTDADGAITHVVIESRIFALVLVPAAAEGWDALSDEERAERLARHAATLFTGPLASATWTPVGARFTSAPGVHLLTMPGPEARADAGAWGHAIYFLTYRKPPSSLSPPDPRAWIDAP